MSTDREMVVRSIRLREVGLRLREPFRISSGVIDERRILLLELVDADGLHTWAECVAGEYPNYSPETIDTAWHAITSWIAPRVIGRPLVPEALHPLLDAEIRGHEMAKASVEMGAWALLAHRRNESLSETIGGTRDRVATGISIGIQASPDALVERAVAARAAGYRKVKVKVRPGQDVEYVRAVRSALGNDVAIMADANSAYRIDRDEDVRALEGLDAFGLTMIEQPLSRDDLRRHAELQSRLATPICLDESITSVERAADMIAMKAGRIVNVKPGRVGGFAVSKGIHDLCRSHGIPVWCGGMLESGVGRAYNVALASLPNFTLPGDLSPSARYWERDLVDPEWTMDGEGMVRVPRDHAGIGVRVDVARVDDLTVRSELIS